MVESLNFNVIILPVSFYSINMNFHNSKVGSGDKMKICVGSEICTTLVGFYVPKWVDAKLHKSFMTQKEKNFYDEKIYCTYT